MASQEKIQEGMYVMLLENDTNIAEGTIFTMDPNRSCHNKILGDGYVSISLKVVYDKPITPSHDYLLEHVGSFVRWEKSNLRPQSGEAPSIEDHASSSKDKALPIESSQKFDQDNRSTWPGHKVIVLDKEKNKLGFAFIVVAFTNEVVDGAYLGEDDIRITVFEIMVGVNPFKNGKLIRWPIKNLALRNGESLLGPIHATDEKDSSNLKKYKRPYRFIKRKKAKSLVNEVKNDPCDMENIANVASIDCCPNHCCQYADRKKIFVARTEYHALNFDDQTTFTYDSFATSVKGEDGKYKGMLFDRNIVCCKGWYTIYGICSLMEQKRAFMEISL